MGRKRGLASTSHVRDLGERIEHWRRTRLRRKAMPAALWEEATAVARRAGVYAVSRALGLNYQSLKRRVAEGSAKGQRSPFSTGGFVELSGAQLIGANGPVVELTDEEGTRLTIRLGSAAELDVAKVVDAFRWRRA